MIYENELVTSLASFCVTRFHNSILHLENSEPHLVLGLLLKVAATDMRYFARMKHSRSFNSQEKV